MEQFSKTIQKMINFDYITKDNIKVHNPNLTQIANHPNWTLLIWGSESGQTNALFNLIACQLDIDRIYLYAKDPCEVKHQFLINKFEGVGLKKYNASNSLGARDRFIKPIFHKRFDCFNL